ncbi:MAG: hypothetical protein PF694_07780 [Bacteroidetes bacterium]|jgi:hypothetical protein|nr:hypothetical protein [Bacteroidota bacterium]
MKYIFLFALCLLLTTTGCKKLDELTQFNMDYNVTVVIPSSTGINLPFNLFAPDIESNSQSTFAVNDTRKDLVEEIKLTKMNLTLTSPSDGDFGFLKSIEIFISADGVPEKKIAWKENISSSVDKYIELETTDTDLKEFLKKEEYSLRLSTVTDEIISSDHYIDIYTLFFVDAKVLGL